jgi:ABC-2 type transport system ATP-binding protein
VPALATHELTKDYAIGFWRKRPYRALDHLTLDVEAGEVFGFLGPNGAGKTTTLKLLMQLVHPTKGHAEILDQPVGTLSVKHRIGYLPENPYFYDHLTAEELLAYYATRCSASAARSVRSRQPPARWVGAWARSGAPAAEVLGDAAARRHREALINDPELIILDEPMSGLDPLGGATCGRSSFAARRRADGFSSARMCSATRKPCAAGSRFWPGDAWSPPRRLADMLALRARAGRWRCPVRAIA